MNAIERIRQLMNDRGWTMYKLSKQASISQSIISNLINRGNEPSIYTLIKICDAFDITLSQFFSDDNLIVLTDSQMQLIKKWCCLDTLQKEKVDIYISGMLVNKGSNKMKKI